MRYIGIDIGGTNLKAGMVDEGGRLMAVQKMKIASVADAATLAWTLHAMVVDLCKETNTSEAELFSVGVGCPGTVQIRSGSILSTCNLPFRNVPLRRLYHQMSHTPFYIENDANCAALGEYYAGAGRGSKRFITVTLGTGVGGGIIHNGKIYHGSNGIAGEVGHMTVDMNGEECPCGNRGCWEGYASATALKRQTKEAWEQNPNSILARVSRCARRLHRPSKPPSGLRHSSPMTMRWLIRAMPMIRRPTSNSTSSRPSVPSKNRFSTRAMISGSGSFKSASSSSRLKTGSFSGI